MHSLFPGISRFLMLCQQLFRADAEKKCIHIEDLDDN